MRRAGAILLLAAVVGDVALGVTLLARERGGPPHRDVTLPGDVPGTIYLPDGGAPAPAVVVGHGYSGDRATMSSLARSLAEAGYAALAIDFRGHGANPNPFGEGPRAADLGAAFDWLEGSQEVDGERLAVLGHSMGAHAALEFSANDPRPDATVVLGSAYRGATGTGPILFVYGANESSSVEEASEDLSTELEDARTARIDGANHITILWFDETVAETVAWLDQAFGVERSGRAGIEDPRLGVAAAYAVCMLAAFVALGWAVGRVGPASREERPAGPRELALLLVALVVAAPAAAFLDPAGFLGAGFGDVVSYLVVAGVVLYVPRLRGPRPVANQPLDWLRGVAVAAPVGLAGAFFLVAPLGGVAHRLVPTVPRAFLAATMTPLLALFFVQLHALFRRGPVLRASVASVAAHGIVLVALAVGVLTGGLPGVAGLALPLLAGAFALVEIFGIAAYSVRRNGALVGVVEALWIAGLAAVAMPLP